MVNDLNQVTPKTKSKLKLSGLIWTPKSKDQVAVDRRLSRNFKKGLKKLREQWSKAANVKYNFLARFVSRKGFHDTQMRDNLEVQCKFWKWATLYHEEEPLPPRSDSVSEKDIANIHDIYTEESDILPTKATVGKSNVQKVILKKPIKEIHREYRQKGGKLSLSKFQKLRPSHVLLVDRTKFIYALCESCINCEFNLRAINKAANTSGMKTSFNTKYSVAKATVCGDNMMCMERKCDICGVDRLKDIMMKEMQNIKEKRVTWQKWEDGRTEGRNQKKQKFLKEVSGTVEDCIIDLCQQVQPLTLHLFIAKWQRDQINNLTRKPPADWVISIADFSENYRCQHQDEISAAFYHYTQATVIPIVAYYSCPECHQTVEEACVFISEDLEHDSHVYYACMRQMKDRLTMHRGISAKSHHVQVSDGCSSQFKSKAPFQYLSETENAEHVYFGSRHGKSVCDALGGIVKSCATRFVRSRRGKNHKCRRTLQVLQ